MNHVPKCASTVSWQLYHAYHNVLKVPNITTKQRLPTNAQLATPQNVWLEDTFSFALFRDPLGRIHSSYCKYNTQTKKFIAYYVVLGIWHGGESESH